LIAGHYDFPWMTLTQPALTVSAQPIYEMGLQAIELLILRIQGVDHPICEV
jgi:LacI family transcriptional regulator